MWSVANAKSQLSEILRRARLGQPQFIGMQGAQEPCVVVSASLFHSRLEGHDGLWLIEHAGHIGSDIVLPDRSEDRADPDFGAML